MLGILLGGFHSALAQDIDTLLNNAENAKAYELGQQQLPERAGDPQFDFWFGLAALENGRPQEAVFAFERALEMQPWNQRLRLELARAHFLLGNYEQAKALFETVLASDPPPQVKANIQKFFDLLNRNQEARTHSFTKSVQVRAGMDSNINSATQIRTVTLPVGITLPLSDTSRETSDDFIEAQLDLDYARLMHKELALFTGMTLKARHNSDFSVFDTNELGLRMGGGWAAWKGSLRIPLQWQTLMLDRKTYRENYSLGLEWSRVWQSGYQFGVFAQRGKMKYPDQPTSDADLTLGGGGWGYRFKQVPVMLALSAYVATEDAQLQHLGRDYNGVRVGTQWKQGAHQFELSWLRQESKYAAIQPIFGKVRDDNFSLVTLSWAWSLQPDWQITFNVEAANNKSSIDLYTYYRNQSYVSVKYSF
ncbi:MAG: tetratricopeptide repeat protein [Gammaproteobacteria bacterium]|nr:tetratricopeptide repeat protein [Gammaproteobacteria bacterium]